METVWSTMGRQPKWGGDGKLSHARNPPSWSGAIPGAHRQGPLISEGLLWGNRYGWWDSRDGDMAVGKFQISAQLEEEVGLFCPRKGRAYHHKQYTPSPLTFQMELCGKEGRELGWMPIWDPEPGQSWDIVSVACLYSNKIIWG